MTGKTADKRLWQTPFHARVAAACESNEWYPWKNYTCAQVYTSVEQEYFTLRNAAGLFDLTPMTKYRIAGPDGLAYLDRLVTRRLDKLAPGRVSYCVWCDDAGHVLDDGTVFSLGDDQWRLCSQEQHLDWLLWSAEGFNVEITEETDTISALALQGPTSCMVLKNLGLTDIENLKPFHLRRFTEDGMSLMVSRTGFTGDLGYELWFDPANALDMWDRLMAAGRDCGIRPVGAHALEITRIEAGFIQAGVDFVPAGEAVRPGSARSPFELGLGWLVDLDKPVFNGRGALLEEKARGARYRLVKLDVEGNKPATDSFIYNGRRKVIGHVTSAAWSPSAKTNIAIASLDMPWGRPSDTLYAEVYYNRELRWNRLMARCTLVDGPFFAPPRRRQTPAPDF